MSKDINTILLVFDDAKDAKEVMAAINKKTNITWDQDTKEAMIKGFPKEMKILVSKSITVSPKPIKI